jgi:RNA polymerase nonessential primary-like sigma factor
MPTANLNPDSKAFIFTADMVRSYLHEIGRVPLLTHEQEIIYGKQVQKMMACLETQETLRRELGAEPSRECWSWLLSSWIVF